jgi:hypothetical protein
MGVWARSKSLSIAPSPYFHLRSGRTTADAKKNLASAVMLACHVDGDAVAITASVVFGAFDNNSGPDPMAADHPKQEIGIYSPHSERVRCLARDGTIRFAAVDHQDCQRATSDFWRRHQWVRMRTRIQNSLQSACFWRQCRAKTRHTPIIGLYHRPSFQCVMQGGSYMAMVTVPRYAQRNSLRLEEQRQRSNFRTSWTPI